MGRVLVEFYPEDFLTKEGITDKAERELLLREIFHHEDWTNMDAGIMNEQEMYDEAVKRIPKGCVATYAQVAEAAGDRKMARAVGNALHKNPDPSTIPCHRVVNAKGQLAGEYAFGGAWKQAEILMAEGVEVEDGKVDLERFQWKEYLGK